MLAFVLATVQLSAAAETSYHYYRTSNFDVQIPLRTNGTSAQVSSSRAVTWNTTFRNFDSEQDVYVTRFDVFHEAGEIPNIRLGGADGMLRLPEGPAYLFTGSGHLTVEDVVADRARTTATSKDPVWLSTGSCVTLDVVPEERVRQTSGNITVLVVSSGRIDPTLQGHKLSMSECKASTVEKGYEDLHNNPIDYVSSGKCRNPLSGPGGAKDFDDLDAPIKPLQAHYHTRSAIYYTTRGASSFNDPGQSPLTVGEMRFVTAGHFYGPETMWGREYYVLSLHESDPAARRTGPSNPPRGFEPCPFACLDKLDEVEDAEDLMRCVVKKEL